MNREQPTLQRRPDGPLAPERPSDERPQQRHAPAPIGRAWLWRLTTVTLLAGLTVTVVLTLLARSVYAREQHRLLALRVRDAGALIAANVPGIETPLASAAELADATGGNVAKFRKFTLPYVGPGRQFDSLSLWSLAAPEHGPATVVGGTPRLLAAAVDRRAFFRQTARSHTLSVIGLLDRASPRIGYAFTTPGARSGYAAYGEVALPARRRAPIARSSAFAGLDYAIYLGRAAQPAALIATSATRLPLRETTARETIPFGDSAFTLVMGTNRPLGGSLPRDLPWIIAGAGVFLSLVAAGGTLRLIERRRRAERLATELEEIAAENRRLYAEQRTISETLQHALLPEELPQPPGTRVEGRYIAGERNVDIGGDWYDVIQRADRRLLLIVGDVSGRGVRAATTMAALRHAIHAYAAQGDPPEAILGKLTGMISVVRQGQLATVLCAEIDLDRHDITICVAGHLPPLLISDGEARYLEVRPGLPIGVDAGATYTPTRSPAPAEATLLGFSDGLVERRGEHLDEGLERVRAAAVAQHGDLEELLGTLVAAGPADVGLDDIAIVGVRWTS